MRRLSAAGDGRYLFVPLDHSLSDGPVVPRARRPGLLGAVIDGGADAVVVHKGRARAVAARVLRRRALVLQLSAGTAHAADADAKVLVSDVEEAVRLGADAVSVHVGLGSDPEHRQLADLGGVAASCDRWNASVGPGVSVGPGRTDGPDGVWTGAVDRVLRAAGMPPLTAVLRIGPGGFATGATGKVLTYEMREVVRGPRSRGLPPGGGPVTAPGGGREPGVGPGDGREPGDARGRRARRAARRGPRRPPAGDRRLPAVVDARRPLVPGRGGPLRPGSGERDQRRGDAVCGGAGRPAGRPALRRRPGGRHRRTGLRCDMCAEWMFPGELRDGAALVRGDGETEPVMRRNFAVTRVRLAGSLEGCACPCSAVHAGWSQGLGVTVTHSLATACLRSGAPACRLVIGAAGHR